MNFFIGLFVLGFVGQVLTMVLPEPKDKRGLVFDWASYFKKKYFKSEKKKKKSKQQANT